MKVTVELTDEQADSCLRFGRNGVVTMSWHNTLCDAIVAARPKPPKVGDWVFAVYASPSHSFEIIAFGTEPRAVPTHKRWMVMFDASDGRVFYTWHVDDYRMADGSPIVWPE